MHLPVSATLLWLAALLASLMLAVVTWRSMTGGQRLETREPDGQGGRRVYSRIELAVLPPALIGVAGFVFPTRGDPVSAFQIYEGLLVVGLLVIQCVIVGVARRNRRERRKRREDLFGE